MLWYLDPFIIKIYLLIHLSDNIRVKPYQEQHKVHDIVVSALHLPPDN
jgi:hypothetical protein